jgi:hypothetical protein
VYEEVGGTGEYRLWITNAWWMSHLGDVNEDIGYRVCLPTDLIEVPSKLDMRVWDLLGARWSVNSDGIKGEDEAQFGVQIQSIWHDQEEWHVSLKMDVPPGHVGILSHPDSGNTDEDDGGESDGSQNADEDMNNENVDGGGGGNRQQHNDNRHELDQARCDQGDMQSEVLDEDMAEEMMKLALVGR